MRFKSQVGTSNEPASLLLLAPIRFILGSKIDPQKVIAQAKGTHDTLMADRRGQPAGPAAIPTAQCRANESENRAPQRARPNPLASTGLNLSRQFVAGSLLRLPVCALVLVDLDLLASLLSGAIGTPLAIDDGADGL